MIAGVFRRLFGNFREGALVHAKFSVTTGGAAPVYALKTNQGNANFNKFALVGASAGNVLTLTLAGGARNIACVQHDYINIQTPGTPGNFRRIDARAAIVEGTGVLSFAINDGVTAALSTSVTGDEIHFTCYVDK